MAKNPKQAEQTTAPAGFGANATVVGEVTRHETERNDDRSAKYRVDTDTRQQRPPEGLERMLELLNAAVEPLEPHDGEKGGGNGGGNDGEKNGEKNGGGKPRP